MWAAVPEELLDRDALGVSWGDGGRNLLVVLTFNDAGGCRSGAGQGQHSQCQPSGAEQFDHAIYNLLKMGAVALIADH